MIKFLLLATKFRFGLIFSERLERKKGLRPFDLIIPLRVGRPFQGERREVQTPPLCEFRLAGGVWLVGLTSVFAPVNYWRKGLLRFWLAAEKKCDGIP